MPITFETPSGPIEVEIAVVEAVMGHAERMADLAVAALIEIGIDPSNSCLPAWAYLEIAALGLLRAWEHTGMSAHLGDQVPSFADASRQLTERMQRAAANPQMLVHAELSERVFRVWMTSICWETASNGPADIVATGWDEDRYLDALAEVLWNHRHQLPSLDERRDER